MHRRWNAQCTSLRSVSCRIWEVISMDYTTLGRTGLRVSVAGLGCGGFSRLGMSTGKTEAEAVALVRLAIDNGITLVDTAANYGTEAIVGKAISAVPRESIVVA